MWYHNTNMSYIIIKFAVETVLDHDNYENSKLDVSLKFKIKKIDDRELNFLNEGLHLDGYYCEIDCDCGFCYGFLSKWNPLNYKIINRDDLNGYFDLLTEINNLDICSETTADRIELFSKRADLERIKLEIGEKYFN